MYLIRGLSPIPLPSFPFLSLQNISQIGTGNPDQTLVAYRNKTVTPLQTNNTYTPVYSYNTLSIIPLFSRTTPVVHSYLVFQLLS
jgi:hypothetical protein